MAAPNSPLQSFFRLTIMAGTAIVGGMALKVYGPPPEKIGPMIDRAVEVVQSLRDNVMDNATSPAAEPAAVASTSAATPAALPAPTFDAAPAAEWPVEVAPATQPFNQTAPLMTPAVPRSASVASAIVTDPSLEPLVSQLELAGVEHLELSAWGAEGQLVRCSCTASVSGSAFRRMLDTIEANPREALQGVLMRVQTGNAIAQAY